MDEDKVLQEIRKITLDDSLPLDKVLKQVIDVSQKYLNEYEKRASDHTGIVNGNILTYLISFGIDKVMETHSKTWYQISSAGIGLIPHSQFYIYVKGANSYLQSHSGQQFLIPASIPFIPKKENGNSIFIRHGMLFLNIDINPHIVYIIPNPSLLKIYGRSVLPIGSENIIQISSPSDEVISWIQS